MRRGPTRRDTENSDEDELVCGIPGQVGDERRKPRSPTSLREPRLPLERPPVAPRSISGEKPRSILKNTSSSTSLSKSPSPSKRRVSFGDDDAFSEPRLRFGPPSSHATKLQPDATAVVVRENDVEPVSHPFKQSRVVEPLRSASESAVDSQQPRNLLPESPNNSPIIAHRQRTPPAENNSNSVEKKTDGGTRGSDSRPSVEVLPKFRSTEAVVSTPVHTDEELSPLPDVTVSDTTPSPKCVALRQGSGGSSVDYCMSTTPMEQDEPSAVRSREVFPDEDMLPLRNSLKIEPVLSEARRRHSAEADGILSSFLAGQMSSVQESGNVMNQPLPTHTTTWYGGDAEAIVRPLRERGPTAAVDAGSQVNVPASQPQEEMVAPLFVGDVDPADLVFDDSPAPGMRTEDENDGDLPVAPGVLQRLRAIDFSVQLYPSLVEADEPLHVATPAAETSTSNITENNNGEKRVRGRKERSMSGSKGRFSVSPQPVVRWSGAANGIDHAHAHSDPAKDVPGEYPKRRDSVDQPPQGVTDFVVKCDEMSSVVKGKQGPLLDRAGKLTTSGATSPSLLGNHRQAKPVVVEYINKLSASWQETLRSDMHRHRRRRGRFINDVWSPRHPGDMAGQLFPGFFFGQGSPTVDTTHQTTCLSPAFFGTSPLLPIRRTEIVKPTPVKMKNKRRGVKLVAATVTAAAAVTPDVPVAPGTMSNDDRDSGTGAPSWRQAEKHPVTPAREEACAGMENFEDVDSYRAQSSTPPPSMIPRSVSNVMSKKEKRLPQEERHLFKNKAAPTLTTTHKSEEEGEEEKENEMRCKRFDKLRHALLFLASGSTPSSLGSTGPTEPDSQPAAAAATVSGSAGKLRDGRSHVSPRRRKPLLPPPPPSPPLPVTAEGLIRTPERALSPEGSDEALAAQPLSLFAPARSVSPPRCSPSRRNEDHTRGALGGYVSVLPERCVSNRSAMRAFARDVSDITRALRESTWAKML